jgi:hypothetical protein
MMIVFQIMLDNINFVKIIILWPKHQKLKPKLNALHFEKYIEYGLGPLG